MTENKRFCKDCKHTKGIEYDFWCGEGHTEYEVFEAETNCPYYEFHDWSKGVPNMTENERFTLDYEDIDYIGIDEWENKEIIKSYDIFNGKFKTVDLMEIVDRLNELHDENQELKQSIKEVLELLEEEVDLFSDKATEHDINAYIELRKLDNKDAYYMAISTKKAITLLKEMMK